MDAEQIFLATLRQAAASPSADWVEWKHISKGKTHCETCLKLDGCWFVDHNKPQLPQHAYCHCEVLSLPYTRVMNEATAAADYRKFDPYLFNRDLLYDHAKQKLFESWGYHIEDSAWLREELIKQGQDKYTAGEYVLGKLNHQGQRISIRVEIPRRNGEGTVSFITGWMVYPNGHIRLNTPYGGK